MILKEEEDIVNRGIDNATKLLAWYNERLCSVQKRSRLVNKGMVSLVGFHLIASFGVFLSNDTSVHEQKLNYLRAHISELNRRMTSLMESSEHGFPTHSNLQVIVFASRSIIRFEINILKPVKTQMPQPSDDRAHYLQRQNRMLCQVCLTVDSLYPSTFCYLMIKR
ncbi:unnamed protein product [Anisakis simplex]|uniref:Uncharacterized protein n=1 Tax=Anisakis simplex TaxID=6269 RepID=A0A0M3KED7_ANISI|nr:unnamed protein product [Anisakis simplex]